MKNFLDKFKDKKAVITIICAVICIGILVFAYNKRVSKKVKSQDVPYALETITARTAITSEMVGTIKVASSMLTENVITSVDEVVGKYVNYNTTIAKGSLFYDTAVVDWSEMPDSAWKDIKEGNTILSLPINGNVMVSSAIYPGVNIDLYYKTTDGGKLVYGKFVENVNVLAVKDSSGNYIFEKSSSKMTASSIIFSLSDSEFLLLKEAALLGGSIVPVLRNSTYQQSTDSDALNVSSTYIVELIKSQVKEAQLDETTDTTETEIVIDGVSQKNDTTNNTTDTTNNATTDTKKDTTNTNNNTTAN